MKKKNSIKKFSWDKRLKNKNKIELLKKNKLEKKSIGIQKKKKYRNLDLMGREKKKINYLFIRIF